MPIPYYALFDHPNNVYIFLIMYIYFFAVACYFPPQRFIYIRFEFWPVISYSHHLVQSRKITELAVALFFASWYVYSTSDIWVAVSTHTN
jgi:hypothetical protein